MIYHVGLLKGKNGKRVIVQLRSSVDDLDCETWRYLGARIITKTEAKEQKSKILEGINKQFGAQFQKITID